MKIEHLALWTEDLDTLKDFYVKYFKAQSNELYINDFKGFKSYFLSFDGGSRLELMMRIDIEEHPDRNKEFMGLTHMAFSVGSKETVDQLTETLRKDGYKVVGEPRNTGDGYYESVILDPDGNRIEIII